MESAFHAWKVLFDDCVCFSKLLYFETLLHLNVDLAIELRLGPLIDALRQIEDNQRRPEGLVADEDVLFDQRVENLQEVQQRFTVQHKEVFSRDLVRFKQVIIQTARALGKSLKNHFVEPKVLQIAIRMKNPVDVLLQWKAELLAALCNLIEGIQNWVISNDDLVFKGKRLELEDATLEVFT